jgi:hypothetical protein
MATLGSLRTYTRMINILRKAFSLPEDDIEFLKDSQKVIDWIESSKYALNSKKAIYIAIVGTLKAQEGFDVEPYRSQMEKYNKEVVANYETQTLSVSEQTKYLPWSEILHAVEKARLAVEDVWTLQEYILLALYTLQAPARLDYGEMKIVKVEPENPVGNYLVWCKKPYFYFSEYKTFKVYGVMKIQLSPALVDVLKEWLHYPTEYLLEDRSGNPLGAVASGQLIISTFQKHCNKKIGVSVLRHSYISHIRSKELPIKQSDALARMMMHSPKMSVIYRKIT